MGTDVAEAAVAVTKVGLIKVHSSMCSTLMELVDRITDVLPEIEAARPRCSAGISALCTLTLSIEKAKSQLQSCRESSKLYLAFTGESILARFTKSRSLMKHSLCKIQDMVPVLLAAKISQIVVELEAATFVLDPCEEEAGKVLQELIREGASDSTEASEIKSLQLAMSRLHILSHKDILIEKRSIQRLTRKVSENDSKKRILLYFSSLIKKYEKLIVPDQTESASACYQSSHPMKTSGNDLVSNRSARLEPHLRSRQHEVENNILMRAVPPEEFRCPISSRLMYDPVVIASGQSYERMWIQKWFDEGHDTCQKTGMKLTHFSLTPNSSMKELISRWCKQNGVNLTDPSTAPEALHSLEFSSTSIASFGSSMNDIQLRMDYSNVSLGFIDASFNSDSSRNKITNGLSSAQNDDGSGKFQSCATDIKPELEFLSNLGELSWDSRCKVVEEVKRQLKHNDKTYHSLTNENFVEPLVAFLRDADDSNDVNALKDGLLLLLTFVSKNRNEVPYLREDAFGLLSSFLDSVVVAEEVFTIMDVLSGYPYCRSKIMASGALTSIISALNSQVRDLQEKAVKVLYKLSSNHDICSHIASFDCIPKLAPLLADKALVEKCLFIMKNLCDTEEARTSVAETSGCIASIAEVLENGSSEEQDHAVDILLSLCSQRTEYCEMVMVEGVIPPLVYISKNGSDRGQVNALELLRQLKDVMTKPEHPAYDLDADRDTNYITEERPSRTKRFFGKFSKFGKNNVKRK